MYVLYILRRNKGIFKYKKDTEQRLLFRLAETEKCLKTSREYVIHIVEQISLNKLF